MKRFLVLVAFTALGCSSSSGDPDSTAQKTAYTVSCDGDVVETTSFSIPLRPKHADVALCGVPDAEITYVQPPTRCGTNVYLWDGTACKEYATSTAEGTMHCAGADCILITKVLTQCEADHADCVK